MSGKGADLRWKLSRAAWEGWRKDRGTWEERVTGSSCTSHQLRPGAALRALGALEVVRLGLLEVAMTVFVESLRDLCSVGKGGALKQTQLQGGVAIALRPRLT